MIRLRAKALSLKQPWASMIADGEKTIETRKWRTPYRGPLFICSSKRPVGEGPVGVALAVARLVDCRRFTRADVPAAQCEWYDGYGLHLADAACELLGVDMKAYERKVAASTRKKKTVKKKASPRGKTRRRTAAKKTKRKATKKKA